MRYLGLAALLLLCHCSCSQGPGPRRDGGVDAPSSNEDSNTPACADQDSDTICDADEGESDPDNDGLPSSRDPDSDNDGILDRDEAGDRDPSTPPRDTNMDGVPDAYDPDVPTPRMDGGTSMDGASVYDFDAEAGMVVPERCPPSAMIPMGCMGPTIEGRSGLCNQLDDDCDGMIDEQCSCSPGEVQPCFRGPPGRRDIGACADGMQQCISAGEFGGVWGACTGGIPPSLEVCDGLDNDCNGCSDEIVGCTPIGLCPGPGDPRVPDGAPFVDYMLRGGDFYSGMARTWSWTVEGGPCESVLPRRSFTLTGASSMNATFRPTLSGDYTVTLTVVSVDGEVFTCTWIVHIRGPGLRVEMCYPECETQDLDLFLSGPRYMGRWYLDTDDAFQPSAEICGWHDCEALIRGTLPIGAGGGPYFRADWGYAPSPLSECQGGPLGAQWRAYGECPNPRLDIDNNLSEGIGLPENINIDAPREGETFRVMVQNFTGAAARPIVNIYCGGRRVASYGVAPDTVTGFTGVSGFSGIGAMWRVVDIATHVDAAGETTCDVEAVLPPGMPRGYDVTFDNDRF